MHPIERAYRDYGDLVLRRARCLLGNEADAHEVVQEVFSRWWARPRLFAGRARVSTWLYVVTTRACLNLQRKSERRRNLLDASRDLVSPNSCSFDLEHRALLCEFLSQLPELQAQVLVHHYMDGMTHREIAEGLGKTRRRVGQLIDAALERLQQLDADMALRLAAYHARLGRHPVTPKRQDPRPFPPAVLTQGVER